MSFGGELGWDVERVQLSGAHGVEQGGAFDQLVAAQGQQPALGHAAHGVVRATDPLQKG